MSRNSSDGSKLFPLDDRLLPQFCFCSRWEEAAYLLYKDVSRDVKF